MIWWLLPLAAYLLGSVSFAWLVAHSHGIDLRQVGSGNLGATNVARVLGRRWFLVVFLCDIAKGTLPVLIAIHLAGRWGGQPPSQNLLAITTAVGAVLGHIFTCFHDFRGGKAVATSLGVLLALMPWVAGYSFLLWLMAWLAGWTLFRLKRTESVGPASVLAALAAPGIHWWLSPDPLGEDLPRTVFIALLALLVVVKHTGNIARLFAKDAAQAEEVPQTDDSLRQ